MLQFNKKIFIVLTFLEIFIKNKALSKLNKSINYIITEM